MWNGCWVSSRVYPCFMLEDASNGFLIDPDEGNSLLAWLAETFGLSTFDKSVVVIALAAAFLAAEEGEVVRIRHILLAMWREYQKMDKPLSENELRGETHEG